MEKTSQTANISNEQVKIPAGDVELYGDLNIPANANSLVVFVHGSGSSRKSPRNRLVAQYLNEIGLGTLLFDLLTEEEEVEDLHTRGLRFDIGMLTGRVIEATQWLIQEQKTKGLKVGYFGASTGAAAALVAAARLPQAIGAIVSRGGRPDLAGQDLSTVRAPTLLIVGGYDTQVIELNQDAFKHLLSKKELVIVPGATHLFEEQGKLEEVAQLAGKWFKKYLALD